jgi:hypothetical protein
MPNQTKRINGYLIDKNSKEIVADVTVDISLIFPTNPADRADIKGTLATKGFKTQFNDKSYILQLNEKVSRGVRLTLQPISLLHFSPMYTRYDVWFENSAWHSSIDWFESL